MGATWAPQLDRVPSGEDTVLDVRKSTQHQGASKHRERQGHRASAAPKEMEAQWRQMALSYKASFDNLLSPDRPRLGGVGHSGYESRVKLKSIYDPSRTWRIDTLSW